MSQVTGDNSLDTFSTRRGILTPLKKTFIEDIVKEQMVELFLTLFNKYCAVPLIRDIL